MKRERVFAPADLGMPRQWTADTGPDYFPSYSYSYTLALNRNLTLAVRAVPISRRFPFGRPTWTRILFM